MPDSATAMVQNVYTSQTLHGRQHATEHNTLHILAVLDVRKVAHGFGINHEGSKLQKPKCQQFGHTDCSTAELCHVGSLKVSALFRWIQCPQEQLCECV